MFSKSRINETGPKSGGEVTPTSPGVPASTGSDLSPSAPVAKPPASVLSSDLTVIGNMKTVGDILVEGTVEGDIRAHLLTVGEGATVKGEVVADDVVINGHIVGRVRGLKVRLTSSARVKGDIIDKTIAIESGAHFEGTVQHQEDPLQDDQTRAIPGSKRGRSTPSTQNS